MVSFICVIPILVIVFVALISVIIYFIVYSKRINTIIHNEGLRKNRMISPLKFTIIFGAVVVFGIIAFIVALRSGDESNQISDKYYEGYYKYRIYENDNMPEYMTCYNINNNPGYTKKEEIQGELKYTYFISNERYDTFHPSLIMFIEYTGESDIVAYGYNGEFLTAEESPQIIRGFGQTGGAFDKYLVLVCDRSVDSIFSIEIALYDNLIKYEELGEGSVAHEKLDLYWENVE